MNDPTEHIRRTMTAKINSENQEREELEHKYGKVYTTKETDAEFEFIGFMAPFVTVRRLSDGVKGTMMFQNRPRYYFSFKESLI